MEEEKAQRLHDTLAKLRKGNGLGTSSHFNFGGPSADGPIVTKKDANGNLVREDGLPMNGLYSNFVREGAAYDPKKSAQLKYGDGRAIKRNFDDCKGGSDSDSSDSDGRLSMTYFTSSTEPNAVEMF